MRLRPALVEEAARLAQVHGSAFDEAWTAADIAGLMSAPGGFALALEEGVALIGFILCRAIAGEAEIITLAVDPATRRRGAGRALVDAAAELAGAAGAQSMFLEVAVDNTPAVKLYETAGFVRAGRRPRYYDRGGNVLVDALVMRLDLAPDAPASVGAEHGD